jgi:hypothetical protein
MTHMRQAPGMLPPHPEHVLTCEECRTAARGRARYWIAVLVPPEERRAPPEVVVYCPRCAETHFQFFSRHRRRRVSD